MTLSFRHKGLKELAETGMSAKVNPDLKARAKRQLDTMKVAGNLNDLSMPGWNLHPLQGVPKRHAIWVNKKWRITFQWSNGDILDIDLEQYH